MSSVAYKLVRDFDGELRGAVQRTKDGVVSIVPANADNRDYAEYLEWVALGNTPEPADE